MFYSIAQSIRHSMPFVWDFVEYINEKLFSVRFAKKEDRCFRSLPITIDNLTYRILDDSEAVALERFFAGQPSDAFVYFHPHKFDCRTLSKKIRSRSFITLGVFDNDRLVGYGFLRCFFNGKSFRGKFVDIDHRGKGIAKNICRILTDFAGHMGLRQYGTISKENLASVGSSKAVNDIVVLKELKNDDVLLQYKCREGSEILKF